MDAVEFIKEWNRMLKVEGRAPCIELCTTRTPEETVSSVEQWSAAHPRKTRQSAFLEQWPEAEIDKSGCLMLCPLTVSAEHRGRHGECTKLVCSGCRRKFWMQEVE